jgi:hypothetical protein
MFLKSKFPFWIHVLIETPAALNFIRNPSEQLSSPAPQAHAIIQQYGSLLLVSGIIAFIFAIRSVDSTSRNVAGALSLYHFLPASRAFGRLQAGESSYGKGLGGPWIHLIVHVVCLVSLVQFAVRGRFSRRRTSSKKSQK